MSIEETFRYQPNIKCHIDLQVWKEFVGLVHAKSEDFQNPKFLQFVLRYKKNAEQPQAHHSTIEAAEEDTNLFTTSNAGLKTHKELEQELNQLKTLLTQGFIQVSLPTLTCLVHFIIFFPTRNLMCLGFGM